MDILTDSTAQPITQTRLIRAIYRIRVIAFVYSFALVWLLIFERNYGILAYSLAILHFLLLPHLLYLRSKNSIEPRTTEMQHLLFDSLLFGVWIGAFGFPIWYMFSGFLGVALANLVNRGIHGLVYSVIAFSVGALVAGGLNGFEFQPWASPFLHMLCLIGIFIYTCTVGLVVYLGAKKLALTQQKLRDNETRLRLIVENAGDLIALFDIEGAVLYSSPSYQRLLGKNVHVPEEDILNSVHPDDRDMYKKALTIEANASMTGKFRYRMINAKGDTLYLNARSRAFLQEEKLRILLISTDETLEHEHEKQKILNAEVMLNLAEAVMVWDVKGKILSVNKAFRKLTGYEPDEVIGKSESEFRHALQPPEFYETMARQLEKKGRWRGSSWTRRKDGALYKERRSVSTVLDETSKVMLYVAIFFETDKGAPPPKDFETIK